VAARGIKVVAEFLNAFDIRRIASKPASR